MNIIFAQNFIISFRQLNQSTRVAIGQSIAYFSRQPLTPVFAICPIYMPLARNGTAYMIIVSEKHRAVYHLLNDKTALFTHLLAYYEQPVVLPHEVQT